MTFNRSKSQKSLIQILDKRTVKGSKELYKYPYDVVPLGSPVLSCYFVDSEKAKTMYQKTKMYDVAIPFLDYSVRRELLSQGVSEHRVKLFEGPLPSVMAIFLQEPARFDGSLEMASLKFTRHNLSQLEVVVDGQSISNHPLDIINDNSMQFYHDYLRRTNRWHNMLAGKALSQAVFDDSNFFVLVNLKHEGLRHGQCCLNLKFKNELNEKLYALIVPIYEKRLSIDSYMNVTVAQ